MILNLLDISILDLGHHMTIKQSFIDTYILLSNNF